MGKTAIRLAYVMVRIDSNCTIFQEYTYVFDIWARVDSDNIAVLDSQVVANDSVYPRRAIVEIVISENDEDGIFSLLALDKNGVATEELERLHGVVREGDDRVVIVDCISDAARISK